MSVRSRTLSLVIVVLITCDVCTTNEYQPGDILIAYIDDIFNSKSVNRMQNALSFIKPLTDSSLWPKNVTVGYVIWTSGMKNMTMFMNMLKQYPKIVAAIGIRKKEVAFQLASFTTTIRVPVYTYAHGTIIDDVLKYNGTEYVTRITSHATAQVVSTIPNILQYLGINVISVIYTSDHYTQFSELAKALNVHEPKIEITHSSRYNKSHPDVLYRDFEHSLIFQSNNTDRISTFVFLTGKSDMNRLLQIFENRLASNAIFIGDSSSCTINFSSYETLRSRNVSMIRMCQTFYPEEKLINYLRTFEVFKLDKDGEIVPSKDIVYQWYAEKYGDECISVDSECVSPLSFNSSQNGCASECKSFGEFLTGGGLYSYSKYNHRIYYTVLKILKALENVTAEQVAYIQNRTYGELMNPFTIDRGKIGETIYTGFQENQVQLPANTTFLKYANRVMDNDYEVIFDSFDGYSRSFNWQERKTSKFIPFCMDIVKRIQASFPNRDLTCSKACGSGWRAVQHARYINCWTCEECKGNTISSDRKVSACTHCNSSLSNRHWANDEHTACDVAPATVNLDTTYGQIVFVIALLNLLVLLFTVIIYVQYWKSRVIISSGRYLSICIFAGLASGHTEAILIATAPETLKCLAIQALAHVFMMLTVCPLLVKTFRIWFVFSFSVKLGKKVKVFISQRAVLVMTTVVMMPLILILLIGLFVEPYQLTLQIAEEIMGPHQGHIRATMSCGSQNLVLMYASVAYTGVLLLISSVLGYFCRKLPDNFKESMHIFISSMIALMLVTTYVPAMVILAGFLQVFSLAMVITLISLALNIVLFFPKVYAVIFLSEHEQKKRFKRSVCNGTSSDHESGV